MRNGALQPANDCLALAREVAGADTAFFHQLLTAFVQDCSARAQATAAAQRTGDWHEAARLLHSLKGSALSIGANNMAHAAAQAQRAMESADREAARDAMAAFYHEFDTVLAAIRREGVG
jgi:HPt (histidine-containing phosphotransfer) domain-containing protein